MLGKVKKWFGIEGLKIGIRTEDRYDRDDQKIFGEIILKAKNREEVEAIRIKLIEKYARGRGKNRLIDEYTMADITMNESHIIEEDSNIDIPFEIGFQEHVSQMDELQRKNFLLAGIVKSAKWIKRAKSTYRLEIEAKVKGTKFSPFVKQEIILN